ncbi:hypothetical protein BH09ACT7_BH09ACT7_34330 [soil metagenome]
MRILLSTYGSRGDVEPLVALAVVPQATGQPYWAGRVADLGIGAALDCPTLTVASMSAALTVALAADTLMRAAAVAERIRLDGAAVAATLLLR